MTLRLVADKVLGDWRRWTELRDLNQAVISDPDLLIPGTTLTIPSR
jgi:nucleoid-associated protein YgaU